MSKELLAIVIVIALTIIFGEFCKLIKVPRVLGHLFVGLLLGITVIKDYLFTETTLSIINSLADIGIVLLFFFIGLNINLREFKANIRESFLVSLFNFLIPLFIGFIIFRFVFNFNILISLIIGIILSATSQIISINLLEELKIIKTRVGNLIMTSGSVNDVVELVFISIILAIISAGATFKGVYVSIANILIFIAVLFLLRFSIFPLILRFFEKGKSRTSLFSGALIIALLTAALSSFLGLGIFVGALFAGVIIRQILLRGKHPKPWEEHSIAKSVHLISFGFLVPIFFVAAGLRTDLLSVVADVKLVLILLAIALLGTLGGSILGVVLSKGSIKEGLIVGFGRGSRGDLEIVVSTLALQVGLFTIAIFSSIIVMAFITTLISPIMFKYLARRYRYYLNVKH